MSARQFDASTNEVAVPFSWTVLQEEPAKPDRVPAAFAISFARLLPWLFCASLWLSSLAALWMTRGWIALFLSGQIFSAVHWLLKNLARKTRPASSPSTQLTASFDGIDAQ
jgi:hypothetical protein